MLKEWLESAKAIYQMYRIIANHKINKTDDSEEYNLVLSLLEDGVKFERQKIDALSFTPETIDKMYEEISSYCDLSTKTINPNIYFDDEEYISISRIYNIVESIDAEISKVEYPTNTNNSIEMLIEQLSLFEDYKGKKFEEFYMSHIAINYIYVLSLAEASSLNDKTRSFIIRLMYYSIFLVPSYEKNFIFTKRIAEPISMADYGKYLDCLNEVEKESYIEDFIIELTYQSMDKILELNDYDLTDEETYFIYVKDMIENLARLISLKDPEEVDNIAKHYEKHLNEKNTTNRIRIANEIEHMLNAAKKIIENKNKAKRLGYGITNKETD